MTTFEILGQPQGKARPRVTIRGGFAHAYTPKNTASYEMQIRAEYRAAGGKYYDKIPLAVRFVAVYSIPQSFSRKRRQEALRGILRPIVKPDYDNVEKVVTDALNGLAYCDDAQVVDASFKKFYGEQPKVIVTIMEVKVTDTKYEEDMPRQPQKKSEDNERFGASRR